MATTLSGSIGITFNIVLKEPLADLAQTENIVKYNKNFPFTDGILDKQFREIFSDVRQLANGASETLDLSGVLTDAFGTVIALDGAKLIYIENRSEGGSTLVVGGAASNGFISLFGASTDKIKIKAGGCMLLLAPDATGYAVVAATADQLKIAHAGDGTGGLDYAIILAGRA